MTTANFFRLNALGSLSLQRDGESGTPTGIQKRRLGLLAILAVAGKRGLSRDRIQSFIWPEADPAKSRHALDQLVYATRRAIDADPFLTEGGDLRLDSAVIKTDIAEFEESDGVYEGGEQLHARKIAVVIVEQSDRLEMVVVEQPRDV